MAKANLAEIFGSLTFAVYLFYQPIDCRFKLVGYKFAIVSLSSIDSQSSNTSSQTVRDAPDLN
ncbi:hypothetical protein [Chamaesiphon sp. VAR_69_metabat_338]|uniref:hypothetical protein n=1 Tax=Chamaesiphon sp. VAR_69_metabat_338 TaxID=2964704 RepID=UPI00286E1D78|nr:hypothetical protein [Chamaesiphon sp. VAR_69_metabat_338]